ncbi:MAG: hypothetical protein ACO32I_08460, partial [Candidatus Limnocylindrus sp.]
PAVAVLCALYWNRLPRWVLVITLAACFIASLALLGGATLLASQLDGLDAYSSSDWLMLGFICAICAVGLVRRAWIRPLTLPSVLLVYLGFTIFLRPFDGPIGAFPQDALSVARGKNVVLPAPFTARDELYRFMLPGADIERIREKDLPSALADTNNQMFILSTSLDGPQQIPGFRTLGRRLNLRDYFSGEETADMLRGNVTRHLFAWDLLVEREPSAAP